MYVCTMYIYLCMYVFTQVCMYVCFFVDVLDDLYYLKYNDT